MDRRQFFRLSGGMGLAALTGLVSLRCSKPPGSQIEMPPLPFPPDAL